MVTCCKDSEKGVHDRDWSSEFLLRLWFFVNHIPNDCFSMSYCSISVMLGT